MLTAQVSCTVICKTIDYKHFDFLKFGKPRGNAVRVEDVKVLSNRFWTWKEESWNEKFLVSMNASMVSSHNDKK